VIGAEFVSDGGQLGVESVEAWVVVFVVLKPAKKGGGDVDAVVRLKLVIHRAGMSWDESPNVNEVP